MKRIVHYIADENNVIIVGQGAIIKPIDHPDSVNVSNNKMALTSRVLSYNKETGVFDTVNSVYKPGTP